jgi:6,7-dimethyl-8-ribityllumazine synthase
MAGKSKTGAYVAPSLAGRAIVLEGTPVRKGAKGPKVAVLAARWNSRVTDQLLEGAVARLADAGLKAADIVVARVPGAVELPLAAKAFAATGKYAAVIALGCVIRGDTTHYDYVCSIAAQGTLEASLATGVPVIFGVLTVENLEQALERAELARGNKGGEAAEAALEMAGLLRVIGAAAGNAKEGKRK